MYLYQRYTADVEQFVTTRQLQICSKFDFIFAILTKFEKENV